MCRGIYTHTCLSEDLAGDFQVFSNLQVTSESCGLLLRHLTYECSNLKCFAAWNKTTESWTLIYVVIKTWVGSSLMSYCNNSSITGSSKRNLPELAVILVTVLALKIYGSHLLSLYQP